MKKPDYFTQITFVIILVGISLTGIKAYYNKGKIDGCKLAMNALYSKMGLKSVDDKSLTEYCKELK